VVTAARWSSAYAIRRGRARRRLDSFTCLAATTLRPATAAALTIAVAGMAARHHPRSDVRSALLGL
jgi:hypothetical protein